MLKVLFKRSKTFLFTRLSFGRTVFYVMRFILVFAVIYFATVEYTSSPEEVVKDIAEFFIVAFSLCITFALFWSVEALLVRLRGKRFNLCYGHMILAFIAIYTCGMLILYPIKQSIWDIQKEWFWRYYWRHFPFAVLAFFIFLYREHKKNIIDELIDKNLRHNGSGTQNISPDTQAKEEVYLTFTVNGFTKAILSSAITHISASGHYLDLFYVEKHNYEHVCIRKSLVEIMGELPGKDFVRVHRSHIINLDYITRLLKKDRRCSASLCEDRFIIPVSRNCLPNVESFLKSRFSTSAFLSESS